MERSFYTAARLNSDRRAFEERRRIRSSHFRYFHRSSVPPAIQSLPEMRMATSYHDDDTPPRDNTTPKPTMREAGIPLQPLNQNVESSMEQGKKRTPPRDCYGYKPSPIREDDPRPRATGEDMTSSNEREPHHYVTPPSQYFSRQPYYFEEERPPYSGYLEDDFDGIPPPPAHHHRMPTYHYDYGPPPPPTPPSYNDASRPYPAPPIPYSEEPYSPPFYDAVPAYSPQDQQHREPPFESPPAAPPSWPTTPRSPAELQELDIVCGRGAPTNYHYGNQVFKEVVQEYQTAYLCAKRSDKPQVAMKILDLVKHGGARFVKREKTAGVFAWVEIDSKGAYEKVCQALREGAPEVRRKVLLSAAVKKQAKKEDKDGEESDAKGE